MSANLPNQPEEPKKSFLRKIPGFRSGKPWKIVIASVGYLIILFVVIGIFTGKSGSNNPVAPSTANQAAQQQAQQPKKENLEVLDAKMEGEQYARYVTGTIKNNASRQYKYAQVEINLYDDAGNQVGSTLANTNNLEPNGTWKFKAPVLEENAKSFKVKGVTAY